MTSLVEKIGRAIAFTDRGNTIWSCREEYDRHCDKTTCYCRRAARAVAAILPNAREAPPLADGPYYFTWRVETVAQNAKEEALQQAAQVVRRFQDVTGWQPGESRNALIAEIEAAILAIATPAPEIAPDRTDKETGE